MGKKADQNAKCRDVLHRDLRLLDGRLIGAFSSQPLIVVSDVRNYKFDYTWINPQSLWGSAIFSLLTDLLTTHSISHAHNVSEVARRFLGTENQNAPLTTDLVSTFPEKLPLSMWRFMQALLGIWNRTGHTGIDPALSDFLEAPEKWEQKGKGAYFALLTHDPLRGALNEQELRSIQDAVNKAYESGSINLPDFALVWFLIGTGVRPVQIARMRVEDVVISSGPEGREVTLAVPLAKGEMVAAGERWKMRAPSALAEVLIDYLSVCGKSNDDPLFFDQSVKCSARIRKILEGLDTYSARLDGPVPITPYRFRYTLGTRALAHGASDHEVARLLTHRSTSCIQYYRAAMPALQRPIREAIGEEMALIAKAFQGRLICDLKDATRHGDASALIRDFARLMGQILGACGTSAVCHQHAPIACLSCRKFEPLREAPWEELLDNLKESLLQETEERIRAILLSAVTAVQEIIAERDSTGTEVPA